MPAAAIIRGDGSPHSTGGRSPAGGGTCRPTVRNSSPMNPSGVHDASAIRPFGRHTRASSAAARSWFGVNITPTTDSTASKDPSGYGSASASPCSSSIGRPSATERA
jgi:hypothetical protein